MKPWREIAVPHADVRKGEFQQSEFAADISAVHQKTAAAGYRTPSSSSSGPTSPRCSCCNQVMQRLSKGGEPVIRLRLSFVVARPTMLAVLHSPAANVRR